MKPNARLSSLASSLTAFLSLACGTALAADVTFFSFSDSHYGADDGGRRPPMVQSKMVPVINSLPGAAYPAAVGGTVGKPRAVIMQGDLINDGAVSDKYPTQWANYLADFGVNGEGRCKFPVFEAVGNHDVNPDMFVFNQVKARNLVRKQLGYIQHISPNGYHYSWDWDGVHFVNVNLFPATLSARLVYQAEPGTEVTLHWGVTVGGEQPEEWQDSKPLGVQQPGATVTAEVAGLSPWTTYYYRASARNAKGTAWAGAAVPFHTAGTLPAPWRQAFLGHAQRPGSGAHFADGTLTVRGSGRDIAEGREPIDNCQFAWQELTGDGELVARVATSEVTSREPKAGLMLRESPADGARNVALLLVPRVGVRLTARTAPDGGSRSVPPAPAAKASPCWLKLVRRGDTFTGHVSADGSTWAPVGEPVTVSMGSKMCAGLAVTAGCRDESKIHTATFDHVSCTPTKQP